MLNKKLMILTINLISLLSVSAVSGEDNQVIIGNASDVGTFDELPKRGILKF